MGIVRNKSLRATFFIYLGLGLGFINTIVLFPKVLPAAMFGCAGLLMGAAKLASMVAQGGITAVMNKFFPFYRQYSNRPNGGELLTLSYAVALTGFLLAVLLLLLLKPFVTEHYAKGSELFSEYYLLLIPFSLGMVLYQVLEGFAAVNLLTVFAGFVRELLLRAFIFGLLMLVWMKLMLFPAFIISYSLLYFLCFIILLIFLRQKGLLTFEWKIQPVTRRLAGNMRAYGGSIYLAMILTMLSEHVDTIIIGGLLNLESVAYFLIPSYFANIITVPYRALGAIAMPILARSWKERNLKNIQDLYRKSSINLTLYSVGLFIAVSFGLDILFAYLPENYAVGRPLIYLLGVAKITDVAFGINNEILYTSNKWRFNFWSYAALVFAFIPLNFFLVKAYGIIGSGYANLLAYFAFNLTRMLYIRYQFGISPFSRAHLKLIAITAVAWGAGFTAQFTGQMIPDAALGLGVFGGVFIGGIFIFKVSEDINDFLYQSYNRFIRRQ